MADYPLDELVKVAAKIAADAPAKPGQYVSHCLVHWPNITKLRDVLDDIGIEWRRKP